MAFCELKYRSAALGKAISANIILPESNFAGPFPVLYLLHGLSDDHTAWMRQTSIERYVQHLPLMVVMPDSGRGFYTDAQEGPAWETSIVRDLVTYIDKIFPTQAAREGRCVAGLSMGGYGAIKLALKFPEMFCSAVSHSGALRIAHNPNFADRPENDRAEWIRVFGADPTNGPNDLYHLAEVAGKLDAAKRPALRIDCGTEDFLIDHNRDFHAHLDKIAYPHEYAEFPGAHDWGYWDTHVREAIAFLARNMGLSV